MGPAAQGCQWKLHTSVSEVYFFSKQQSSFQHHPRDSRTQREPIMTFNVLHIEITMTHAPEWFCHVRCRSTKRSNLRAFQEFSSTKLRPNRTTECNLTHSVWFEEIQELSLRKRESIKAQADRASDSFVLFSFPSQKSNKILDPRRIRAFWSQKDHKSCNWLQK